MRALDPDYFSDVDGNAIEDAGEPLPCTFCGSGAEQLVVERWSAEDDPEPSYHVECLKCGSNDPQRETQTKPRRDGSGDRSSTHAGRLTRHK